MELPKAATGEQTPSTLAVSIDQAGQIFLDTIPVDPEELRTRVRTAREAEEDLRAFDLSGLDLSGATGSFDVTWISVSMGMPTRTSAAGGYRQMKKTIEGGGVVTMSAPYKGGWVAAVVKK